MKDREQILSELIADTVANTDKITYFGKDGVLRAIYNAIASVQAEAWNDLIQVKRQILLATAVGDDLDVIASQYGITRRQATKSSVVVELRGATGTLIPAGTIIKSKSGGVEYITKSDITIGTNNTTIKRPIHYLPLADIVIAESVKEGSQTKIGVGELTEVQDITGVSAYNYVPSTGGEDKETDNELRARIISKLDTLAQGTQAFYEGLAKTFDNTVLRAKAVRDITSNGTKIYLLKNSLAPYSQTELNNIAQYIYDNQRALMPVKCENATLIAINVEVSLTIETGYTFEDVNRNVIISIAQYLDPLQREFGSAVRYYDLFSAIARTTGVKNVKSVVVNGKTLDVILSEAELPRLINVTVINYATTQTNNITLSYLIS